jgi:hypothetical protein
VHAQEMAVVGLEHNRHAKVQGQQDEGEGLVDSVHDSKM